MAEDPPRSFVGTSYSWQNDRVPHGSYSLGEADRVLHMLRIRCSAWGRRGQYRIDRLIARYGRDIAVPELRHELAQCPRRSNMAEPCQVEYVDPIDGA